MTFDTHAIARSLVFAASFLASSGQSPALLRDLIPDPKTTGCDIEDPDGCFELFWGCGAIMRLVVEDLTPDAAEIGLTKERIETLAETRLRAARLYDERENRVLPHLYIHVHVVGEAFSLRVEYRKWLADPQSGHMGPVATWSLGGTGEHNGGNVLPLNHLSDEIDRFISEYLRVNETACTE